MADIQINIPITLLPWQEDLVANKKRFTFLRAGRRAGKTTLSVYLLIRKALEHNNVNVLYGAPLAKQAKELIWDDLKRLMPKELIKPKGIKEQAVEIHLVNGSIIYVRGADNYDSIRGKKLWYVILDEAAFIKEMSWETVLRPALADLKGSAMITSTPLGSNWFRQLETTSLTDPEWSVFHFSIYDNPVIPKDEIESIKAKLLKEGKDDIWKQEYLANYVEKIGTVYYEFNLESHLADLDLLPKYRTVVGLDWGLSDLATSVAISILQDGTVYVHDEYSVNNMDSTSVANNILQRTREQGYVPRAYKLDASSFKRERDLGSVAKDYKRAGITPLTKATRDFDSSVSYIKRLLAVNSIKISPKLTQIHAAMRKWQYDDHEPDILAALRYGIAGASEFGWILDLGIDAWQEQPKVPEGKVTSCIDISKRFKKAPKNIFTFKRNN